jgi:tetratricopeptide (TPR) repeat protein
MKIRIPFLLLLIVPIAASAADKWTNIRSANFNVVGNATELQIRAVAAELEQFRDAFTQVIGINSKTSTVGTTVVVFKNEESFRAVNGSNKGKTPNSSGYFQPSEDTNYIAVQVGAPLPRTVYHQYAHEMMRDLPNAVPLWFTEGIAEFFSNFEILTKEKQFAIGKVIQEHVDVLRKGPYMPLDDLFSVDRSSPQYNEREMTGIYHAESWALVNYLMVGSNATRQGQVGDFLKLIISGKPAGESFQSAFKTDTKSMLDEVERYIKDRPNWQNHAIALKDKGVIDKESKVRTLTDAEAEFYSGDLLLHANSLPDAGNHLQQAMKLDPKLASAQASMAMLYYREDRTQEAIDYLKRAIELNPKDYLSQYYYAYVLDKNGTNPLDDIDAKRSALGKAIELMPQFAAAYELLASINLTADIDYDTTIELLRNANKYASGNQNIRFLFAQALVKKNELDQADKALQSLSADTNIDSALRDGVRNLRNFIARTRETENKQLAQQTEAARRDEEAARQAALKKAAAQAEPTAAPQPSQPTQPVQPTAAAPRPKSGELIAVNPQRVRPEGVQVKGILTLVDCRKGLTLTIKSDTDTVTLHTDTPNNIEFVSYSSSVHSSISCGPVHGDGIPVLVTYRPTPGGAAAGEPLVVEFVDR